ncbi:MAG TPA: hypothetical protein VMD55_02100 [Terracidiphilus sp.]|nr:hypothetical protein [Terracidiphilus sp.]
MNTNSQHPIGGNAAHNDAEETLRLIAGLPAPQGLEERVHRALGQAHALRKASRPGRLLGWPAPPGTGMEWMRTAAAAAIAFVIAGGSWGVYRQVQPRQTGNGILLAPHGANTGGFAGAGAMRTPQTLNGPVLRGPALAHPPTHPPDHPVEAHVAQSPSQGNSAKKHGPLGANGAASRTRGPGAKKTGAQAGMRTAKP